MEWLRIVDNDLVENCLEDILLNKEDDSGYGFKEWVENYEYIAGYGFAAFIGDIINAAHGIDITVEDSVVGIAEDVPWNFNEKTRNLSIENFQQIIAKYTNMFLDEPLDIKSWTVE